MEPSLTLALDIGTTSAKLALFDARGRRVLLLREPLSLRFLDDGGVEQDPEDYVRAAKRLLVRAGAEIPPKARVDCAGVACQRSTIVVWEKGTGHPIGPAVTWMDRRGAPMIRRLGHASAGVARRTGLRLSPYYGATHLARRLRSEPALARVARRGSIVAGPVASFVLARIAAASEGAACDPTLAQRTSLFDPWRCRWDPWLYQLFDIPPACLPQVRPTAGPWGRLALRGGRIPVRALAGDQQCAAAAFDLDDRRVSTLVHYGTGAFALWPARQGKGRIAGLLLSVRADRSGGFYHEGTVNTAGSALDIVSREVGPARMRRALAGVTARSLTPGSPLLVPAFTGLGAPHWDESARATLAAAAPCGPDALALAALAGIAHRVADILDRGGEGSGDLLLSGPLTSIPGLRRLQAEVCGRSVRIAKEPEATLRGIARIASRSSGGPIIPGARPGPELRPRFPDSLRRKLRSTWERALRASRSPSLRDRGQRSSNGRWITLPSRPVRS